MMDVESRFRYFGLLSWWQLKNRNYKL